MKKVSFFIACVASLFLFSCANTGNAPAGVGSSNSVATTTTSAGATTTTSTTTTTAPYGMDCGAPSGTASNINTSGTTSKAFFVIDIPGTTVTAITLRMAFAAGGNGTTYTEGTTLDVYTCGDNTSLGTKVDTVTKTIGLKNFEQPFTWTFTSPITIPTSCATGHRTIGFHFSNSWTYNTLTGLQNNTPSVCFLDIGNSATILQSFAVGNGGVAQYWNAVITATP